MPAAASSTTGWIRGAAWLLVGLVVGWGVHDWVAAPGPDGDEPGEEEAAEAEVAPDAMEVAVATVEATAGTLPEVVAATGTVRATPDAERTLSSRGGGRVLATHAAAGMTLRAGDPLVSLDPAPLQGALA